MLIIGGTRCCALTYWDSGSPSGYIRTYVFVRFSSPCSHREMYSPELNSDFTRVSVTQNNLQEMKEIWGQWDDEIKRLFYCHYGDLPYLLDVKIDERLFRALIQVDRIYSKAANGPVFSKRLMNITGISEQWVTARVKQKGGCRCIPWRNLRDLILMYPDIKKRIDVFALSIYGLVIFPKALGHIDEAVSDLFDRLSKWTTPVPVILAETFRLLNACQRVGEGRFIEENIEWRAPWMVLDEILYRCGDFDWVPLLGIWGAVGYAPLLVLRQYRSRQFTPPTYELAQCEFVFMGNNYKRRVHEILNTWNQTRRMKKFAANPMATLEYDQWWIQKINDNIPTSDQEDPRSMEEYLRVIPSELEIIRQDFERKSRELEKRIEQLEEQKIQLGLDVDV
ncbi:hypothetical protein CXB51_002199 [Gossypium anomalum]|uniref:DUF7745 domain-containing protein n=1 Tax=Gossypium anomalum TaxID=47600 RepID=A0A8J5ZQL1_9ROSI|nr:hypothetical protein CXB51_002199 [Gossypium anomalum]